MKGIDNHMPKKMHAKRMKNNYTEERVGLEMYSKSPDTFLEDIEEAQAEDDIAHYIQNSKAGG